MPAACGGSDDKIYTMDPDGGHRRQLARGSDAQWSPDGRRIAYEEWSPDRRFPLVYVMNAAGTGPRRLGRGAEPRRSPDGEQIAFTGTTGDISVVDVDGGGERLLTRTGDNDVAAWAPGRKIVFAHSADNAPRPASGIYLINADGTGLRRVSKTGDDVTPSIGGWSPGGKLVLYAANGISTWRLHDGFLRRLTRGSDNDPTWDPSGRTIAFARTVLGGTRANGIWIVNRDGSAARPYRLPGQPVPAHGTERVLHASLGSALKNL